MPQILDAFRAKKQLGFPSIDKSWPAGWDGTVFFYLSCRGEFDCICEWPDL
jgi:hypothetical protein